MYNNRSYYLDLLTFLTRIIQTYNKKTGVNAVIFPMALKADDFYKDFFDCLEFCDIKYSVFDAATLTKNHITLSSLSLSTTNAALYMLPVNENASLFTYYTTNISSLVLCFSFTPTTYAKLTSLYSSIKDISLLVPDQTV